MKTTIIGGAGFVGCNLAHRLLTRGESVTILDDMSAPGVGANIDWLSRSHMEGLTVMVGDVRDRAIVERAVDGASRVFHLAAQVALSTSLKNPVEDFEINVGGTMNVLEAVRKSASSPSLLYTSSTKVYGSLSELPLAIKGTRYVAESSEAASGITEAYPLDFQSPIGCSKGAADQYVLDYARQFGVRAVVFRMSCIYGPRQWGTEDHGWVACLARRSIRREPITIYGDGRQVRDLLHVEDLIDAMLMAHAAIDLVEGRAFNIGGGPERAVSALEMIALLEHLHKYQLRPRFATWRPGDQRYFVSDSSAFRSATGWHPRIRVSEGVADLSAWLMTDERRHQEELAS